MIFIFRVAATAVPIPMDGGDDIDGLDLPRYRQDGQTGVEEEEEEEEEMAMVPLAQGPIGAWSNWLGSRMR